MKKILITGGTGFLGKHLALRLKSEYQVYLGARNNKQNNNISKITGCPVIPMDVCSMESVRDAFNEVKPNIVIHAAATKFVDLSEKFPMECIDVNVVGSQNVARVAVDKGTEIVIGISTDKAAPPIRNTYGLSKSMMERVFCSMNNKSTTKFTCVRYGNVAWSTGSVLPIWKEMFEKTNKIGTTGPEMRRFFFTVNEAVELIVTAINNIEDIKGKVLTREMKACKIADLLSVWINENGGSWEQIEGRPGERLDEFLVGEPELQYTKPVIYDSIPHFIISFNEKQETCIKEIISSETAKKLNYDEIVALINGVKEAQYV